MKQIVPTLLLLSSLIAHAQTTPGKLAEPLPKENTTKAPEDNRPVNNTNVIDGKTFYTVRVYKEKDLVTARIGEAFGPRYYALLEYHTKKKITPFIYDGIGQFVNSDITAVVLNGKYGLINVKGKLVVPCIYDNMDRLIVDNASYYTVQKDGRYGVINEQGQQVLPMEYDELSVDKGTTYLVVTKDKKQGLMNFTTRKLTMPVEYDSVGVRAGKAAIVKKDGQYTLLDLNGNKLLSNWYTRFSVTEPDPSYSLFGRPAPPDTALVELNGKKGLITMTGKEVIPIVYDQLTRLKSNTVSKPLALIAEKAGKYGLFGTDGKVVLSMEYDKIDFLARYADVLIVKKKDQMGLLGFDGKELLPVLYDEVVFSYHYYLVKKNDQYGLCSPKGSLVLPVEYTTLARVVNNNNLNGVYYLGTKAGKKGIADMETAKPCVDFIYDDVRTFRRDPYEVDVFANRIIVAQHSKYGLVNIGGKTLLPFEYSDMQYVNNKCVIAAKNGKYGVLDIDNPTTPLLPFEYKSISYSDFAGGKIIVQKDWATEEYYVKENELKKSSGY
ncbi:WG repeat-containing protein [Niastella sp. OAS944]|uniref:WG repeat-containing protein n=1 Tax=Niastella sp. OAS944 TaxID=2664089 RepID=UPI0035C8013D|nr:hypothetical protein [Chitinophagaceae bacterium OAS944]